MSPFFSLSAEHVFKKGDEMNYGRVCKGERRLQGHRIVPHVQSKEMFYRNLSACSTNGGEIRPEFAGFLRVGKNKRT